MKLDQETNEKIEELRMIEGQLQNFIAQKEAFSNEMNEVNNAIEELKSSDDEVYKISSGIMIKSTKEKLNKELKEKNKLLEIRINSLEKQEKLLEKRTSELRKEIDREILKSKGST
ncbi:prefoldin subunit [Candidatus Pacearchaeota archaeon]|nr:prefoldin subunit [Candidatus Pacearchaeota archaeon]